ncbi:ROK family protein [Pseudarthrobacter sp. SSS035]|uniref:ROK family protein n=1 Tax=Pseudarthrobacter sp. SSS035 TaxID=2931399 RepID=UPI00200C63B1|nr:ROK family protein [Pseudarthrobacter sp. SSS035]
MNPQESSAVLAFDVGGTDMKVGLLPDGSIATGSSPMRDVRRTRTPRDAALPGDAVVDRIVELTEQYRQTHPDVDIAAIGVGVPGLVDEKTGTGVLSVNLGWQDYPFVHRLRERLAVPVALGHDAKMAGEAEFRLGAARGCSDAIVMVIGTGISGAIFSDGRRVVGGSYAGELGHAPVPGSDGSVQRLECIGAAGAIARRYTEATGSAADGARSVLRMAQDGDTAAGRIWSEAVDAIAFNIAQCVAILGTETVVLGGGLAEAREALFAPVIARVDQLLTFQPRPRIVPAELGQNAGLVGSGLNARELLDSGLARL